MNMNRREFLSAGALAALFAGCKSPFGGTPSPKIAVQTFVLRDLLKKDMPGTYAEIARRGLQGVELWDTPQFDAKTIAHLTRENGLEVCGAHIMIDLLKPAKLSWTLDYAATVGNRRLIVPWMGPDKSEKDVGGWWRRQADVFNEIAAKAKPYGCQVGYHNHLHEFTTKFGDKTVWELFVGKFSDDVIIQWDVGALAHCGEDAAAWYAKYPGRCPVVHLRDDWDGKKGAYGVIGRPPAGRPGVDWKAMNAAFARDMPEWMVIEPVTSDRFDTVVDSLTALRQMGYGA